MMGEEVIIEGNPDCQHKWDIRNGTFADDHKTGQCSECGRTVRYL